jgi:Glycosyl hydrolases family 2, sugar binding domain/Glycosyl hydrolases family 2, TIM barrel domain
LTRIPYCLILASASLGFFTNWGLGASTVSLAGTWRFQIDPKDRGISERWFSHGLPGRIKLPGSLTEQGIGDNISADTPWIGQIVDRSWFTSAKYAPYRLPDNIKLPFWLQPECYYKGAAWYQREIEIPPEWRDRRIVLYLERSHWETKLWIDDNLIGTDDSLNTPHEYDLGILSPGKRMLTIRVDNQMIVDIGENSHGVSDHTQGNWNGIIGRIELRSTSPIWIEELQVYPHIADKSITVKGSIGNLIGQPRVGKVQLASDNINKTLDVKVDTNGGSFETNLQLGDNAGTWDEFSPVTHKLEARLNDGEVVSTTFGLREISTQGTQFVINGRKTFFRGTLECCIFPKTGHPPTDVSEWKRIMAVAKSYGLNHMRFHSYCPPEAAFVAADELGLYLQIETCWANNSTSLGDGKPVDKWVYDETNRILKYFGNHPSFVLMSYGNEPGGKNVDAYLAAYVTHFKGIDSRRLWTSGSGWPQLPENQFHITPDPRIQHWGEGLQSRINSKPPETQTEYADYINARPVPVISHEIGQWCAYPDFGEISEYTGYLKPRNFEIFRDSLMANHMGAQGHDFLIASGKLQTLCYKEEIESALRTPGMGGFQLLDLHDFPGQGTALVGVVNAFWEDKGYVTAAEFSRFCNSTVPLAKLHKRVFTTDEQFSADIEVAHFGAVPLENATTSWKLVGDGGTVVANGAIPARSIPIGSGISLGHVSVGLTAVPGPARYKLVVHIADNSGFVFENDWDVWIYPEKVDVSVPGGIIVTHDLDRATEASLESGGKVLLLIQPGQVKNIADNPVKLGFSSIFWNTSWTNRQAPTTLGILCDPKHPLLADFPTDAHSNWQWWYPINHASPMILDDFPDNLRPTVQVIDDWMTNHRLGLEFEARVGNGKIIVCSIDLDAVDDPVIRQFRYSLLRYMNSNDFDPSCEINLKQIRSLYAD